MNDPEQLARNKLAEYRPAVIDLLAAIAFGSTDAPPAEQRRALFELAKLGFKPQDPKAGEAARQRDLHTQLDEHFKRYCDAIQKPRSHDDYQEPLANHGLPPVNIQDGKALE